MAVYQCPGNCGRLISVSRIPGGNPTALADPKHWAVNYVECPTHGLQMCDRCQSEQSSTACSTCGQPLREVNVTAGAHGAAAPRPQGTPSRVGPQAPRRGKWWKFGRD